MLHPRTIPFVILFAFAGSALPACSAMKYDVYELFGSEKRDLLRSALGKLVGDQKDAQESFATALERVKRINGFQGGNLEAEYDKLKSAEDDAKSSAKAIDTRIDDIETTAEDLFAEWEEELDRIQTASLRGDSERKLRETKSRYGTMQRSMNASRRAMEPALQLLEDHVLYLKHNLNAAAVGSLGGSMREVEESVRRLQASIEDSIREAQSFISTME